MCQEFPQQCFDHVGVFNGQVRFLPNNRKRSRVKTGHRLICIFLIYSHKTNVVRSFNHFFFVTYQN